MSEPEQKPSEVAKLNKIQKLAIFLIILGPESAAHIMKNLDEHELEAVAAEMSKQAFISQQTQAQILREFGEVAIQASTSARGGLDYTQATLEKAIGSFKASHVINRVSPTRAPAGPMQKLMDLDSRQILHLIRQEQPQTIALIVSYLPPERSSEVLELLRDDQRSSVIERLATLSPTPVEVVEKVIDVLISKIGSKPTRALNQTGGVKSAAELLNALDKNTSKTILTSIEERNPDLGASIRNKMFTFEDLAQIDITGLQKIMREVDIRDVAVSLKTASETLKGILLGAVSRRAAETVKEEMEFLGNVKLKEIEAAQLRIIEVVRRLENDGELEIGQSKEGSDSVVFAT